VKVFNTACNSADNLSLVKMADFLRFIFNRGNRKVGWVVDGSHVVFGQKFPGEKGSVSRCFVLMQQTVLWSSKFGANFHADAQKRHSSVRN
jgi:hypothetical protein